MTKQSRSKNRPEESRLRSWRLEQGFLLADVAGLTGLSVSLLSRVERGERGLRAETKVRMARCLGVPVNALFDVEEVDDDVA